MKRPGPGPVLVQEARRIMVTRIARRDRGPPRAGNPCARASRSESVRVGPSRACSEPPPVRSQPGRSESVQGPGPGAAPRCQGLAQAGARLGPSLHVECTPFPCLACSMGERGGGGVIERERERGLLSRGGGRERERERDREGGGAERGREGKRGRERCRDAASGRGVCTYLSLCEEMDSGVGKRKREPLYKYIYKATNHRSEPVAARPQYLRSAMEMSEIRRPCAPAARARAGGRGPLSRPLVPQTAGLRLGSGPERLAITSARARPTMGGALWHRERAHPSHRIPES